VLAGALVTQHRNYTRNDASERDENMQTDKRQEKWRVRRNDDSSYDRCLIGHLIPLSSIAAFQLCRPTPTVTGRREHAAIQFRQSPN
jgi:hypothetical protein